MMNLSQVTTWFFENVLLLLVIVMIAERLCWVFQPVPHTAFQRFKAWCASHAGFLLSFIGALLILSALLEETRGFWLHSNGVCCANDCVLNCWSGEATRSIILTLGSIGALYGLILASRRLDKFSEQVEVGQRQVETSEDNIYSEKLSRAIGFISSDQNIGISSGIILLEELIAGEKQDTQRHNDLRKILQVFFTDQTSI